MKELRKNDPYSYSSSKNMKQNKYDIVSRILHLFIAIAIFLGYLTSPAFISHLIYFHKSIALTIFFMMVIRIVWRWKFMHTPNYQPSISKFNTTIVHIAHILIYIAIFVIIFSGWMGSSLLGYPVPFWFVNLALPLPLNPDLGAFMFKVHEITIWILGGLIISHILGVAYHTIKKERVLQRMF